MRQFRASHEHLHPLHPLPGKAGHAAGSGLHLLGSHQESHGEAGGAAALRKATSLSPARLAVDRAGPLVHEV